MKTFIVPLLALFYSGFFIIGSNAVGTAGASSPERRSADTCADPALAIRFMQVFNPARVAHALGPRPYTINGITIEAAADTWQFQGDIFVAWSTAQNFTVPLYRFDSPTSGTVTDWLYTTNTTASGFKLGVIIGYVYETQVCGSIPLLGAWNKAKGDHYYTTVVNEHSELIAISGWTDAGIAGYVLPLGSV